MLSLSKEIKKTLSSGLSTSHGFKVSKGLNFVVSTH